MLDFLVWGWRGRGLWGMVVGSINCLNFSFFVCSARFEIMSIRSWFVCINLHWKLVVYMFLLITGY